MPPPTLSLVSAVYGVESYLPDYLAGLDRQDVDAGRVEYVFVDDGSPDGSAAMIEAWRAEHPDRTVRLIRQANTGQAGARNAGLAVASGEWISFPDPDDVLAPGYLTAVLRFVDSPEGDDVALVAANLLRLEHGRVVDRHLLRHRFARGTRVADLTAEPDLTVVSASHTFLRRTVLVERGLRQDARIRPVWEDGHLVARYLGGWDRPRVAFLADAKYLYRRREDGTSSMQGSWDDGRKFSDVPRLGWLDALRVVAAERGHVPEWLAHMVLYDLIGYFERERQTPSVTAWLSAEQQADFLAAATDVLALIDASAIESYRTTRVAPEVRQALLFGFKGATRPYAFVDRTDPARRVERIRYFFAGDRPAERFGEFAPRFAKYRSAPFYGRVLMQERVAWVPSDGRVTLELDGRPVRIERAPAAPGATTLRDQGAATAAKALALKAAARTPWARRRYANAWVVLDRDTSAGDRGEGFYRWLREHRPEVNAWFLLRRDCPHWDRLAADGFRLLALRSPRQFLALQHAKHVITAAPGTRGLLPKALGTPPWRLTCLRADALDAAEPDLLVTYTEDEHDALAGDGTPSLLTGLEVKLTGPLRPEPSGDDEGCERTYRAVRDLYRPLTLDEVSA